MVDPNLKDAVWQVLEDYARRDPSASIHSDLIIRKFPKVNELELINAVGELLTDGKITAKAATVDAHGNATAFHIRVRDLKEQPGGPSKPPRSGVSEFGVGFGNTETASSTRATEEPKPPKKVEMKIKDDQIGVGFGVDDEKAPPQPSEEKPERVGVSTGAPKDRLQRMREEAEQNFADEAASFFAELTMADIQDEETKKDLVDQLTVLTALFQSSDAVSFTTPINKLAALKVRIQRLAPELVGDYILLMQTALRAWLARV